MQPVNSLLTQQLTEMNNKCADGTRASTRQFKNLPHAVATALGSSLLAEDCGLKAVGSSPQQLALSCYNIAEEMPQGTAIATPEGRPLTRLDYYQAAANLSPNTKIYWLRLAETLGDDEKVKVGQKTYSKSECLSKSAPLPAMASWSNEARKSKADSSQSGCAEYLHNRSLESKQRNQGKGGN